MIRLWNGVPAACFDSLPAVQIRGGLAVYQNNYDWLQTYAQTDGGRVTALLQRQEQRWIVETAEQADIAEIAAFLRLFGGRIFCRKTVAQALGLRVLHTAQVLRWPPDRVIEPSPDLAQWVAYPAYRQIYALLAQYFDLPDYDGFVSDLSFRIRRDGARVLVAPAAVCIVGWEMPDAAVISALAVDPAHRRQGVGSALLRQALATLSSKTVYVYTDTAAAFYLRWGAVAAEPSVWGEWPEPLQKTAMAKQEGTNAGQTSTGLFSSGFPDHTGRAAGDGAGCAAVWRDRPGDGI